MNVLVATDGSADARAAVDLLRRLGPPATTEVVLLHVVGELDGLLRHAREHHALAGFHETARREAEAILDREADALASTGWKVRTETRRGHAASRVIDAAAEIRAELVVIGSHGPGGRGEFHLGSVSQKVCKYAPCSVLLARAEGGGHHPEAAPPGSEARPLRVLLAWDDSAPSAAAVTSLTAFDLGERAQIEIVTVITPESVMAGDVELLQMWGGEKDAAEDGVARARERLAERTPMVTTRVLEGDTSSALLEAARDNASDLVVLGHADRADVEHFLLGGVSDRVLRYAHSSVLLVR